MSFKKGDKVKVLRRARTHERGWDNSWVTPMTKYIGKIGTVVSIQLGAHDVAVKMPLDLEVWGFPDFVLRLVRKPSLRRKKSS